MKILIITKNWLGDILFQMPAIEAVGKKYPDAEITCMAPKRCQAILAAIPCVKNVLLFDEKQEHRSLMKRLQFVLELRKTKWDQAYLFHRSRTRAFLTMAAGAKQRIGFASGRSWLLTSPVKEPKKDLHHVDYFLYLLERVGFVSEQRSQYHFYYGEEAKISVQDLMQKHKLHSKGFICFHLGANWEPKRWPAEDFAKLADALYEKWNVPVVLTGAVDDLELAHEFYRHVKSLQTISLVGQTSLEELGALFAEAICLVTGDSGPMHICSGVGTPVMALFGPTHPDLTGPRGVGEKMILTHVPEGYRAPWYGSQLPSTPWLSGITSERVFQALEKSEWIQHHLSRAGMSKKVRYHGAFNVQRSKVKKILIVSLSNIGDVILTTPVIMSVAAQFPTAEITVVVGPRAQSLLSKSRFVHRLVIYDKRAKWPDKLKFIKSLRVNVYDYVIDLRNTLIPYLIKVKRRSPAIRTYKGLSMRDKHLDVLKKMKLDTERVPLFDFYNQEDEETALEKLQDLGIEDEKGWIVISPAAASELKTWRLEGFREVIKKLLNEYDEKILLIGDKREKEIINPLCEVDASRVINIAGETNLREVSAIIAKTSLLITNDSAAMHLGYELNRPVVAIFGPTHYKSMVAKERVLKS